MHPANNEREEGGEGCGPGVLEGAGRQGGKGMKRRLRQVEVGSGRVMGE